MFLHDRQRDPATGALTGAIIEVHAFAYDWLGLNTALFGAVNGLRVPALDGVMVAASSLGHPQLFSLYLPPILWCSLRWPGRLPPRNVLVFAAGYAIVSVLLVPALKQSLDLPRPLAALGPEAVRVLGPQDPAHAFPSGHAAFAAMAACALAPGAPRAARIALLAYALVVCLSRVWVGAHFPADVLGGALLGCIAAAAIRRALDVRWSR